nr:hypothetical protein BaRGS_006625 [Batillaria attramentaria]
MKDLHNRQVYLIAYTNELESLTRLSLSLVRSADGFAVGAAEDIEKGALLGPLQGEQIDVEKVKTLSNLKDIWCVKREWSTLSQSGQKKNGCVCRGTLARQQAAEYGNMQTGTTSGSRLLSQHLLSHESYFRYFCKFCQKGFHDKSNLKVHVLIHTGVRPFRCQQPHCTASFTTKQCLQIHYRKLHGFSDSSMPTILREVPFTFEAHMAESSQA